MNPLKLTLENFTGIRNGTGKDKIHLDLSGMPEGLIAIVGPNGIGKTTVMDNLHPYRIMPSRAESYAERAFSFFDHLSGNKALKELVWEHDDVLYKSELIFTVKSKSTNAFLYVAEGEGWKPFVSDDGSIVSDGKVTSYDEAIHSILGSPELYFTSQFLAQTRKDLSQYGTGEMKALMTEMLGIEKYRELSKKAAETADGFKTVLAGKQQLLSRLQGSSDELAGIERQQEQMCLSINEFQLKLSGIAQAIRSATQSVAVAEKNLEDAQKRLAPEKLASDLRNAEVRYHDIVENHKRWEAEKKQVLAHLAKTKSQQAELISNQIEIREAFASIKTMEAQIAEIDKAIEATRASIAEVNRFKAIVTGKESTLKQMRDKGDLYNSQMAELNKVHSIMNIVPCHSTEMVHQCSLLNHAKEAQQKSQSLEKELQAMREQYRIHLKELKDLQENLVSTDQLECLIQTNTKQKELLEIQMNALKPKAALMALLEKALQEHDSCCNLLNQEEQGVERAESAFNAQKHDLEKQISEIKTAQQASTELNNLRLVLTNENAKEQRLIAEKAALETEIAKLTMDVNANTNRITEMKKSIEQRKVIELEIAEINTEISDYTKLSIALGMKGIIALCIDDAGPILSKLTNTLLDCFGSQYQIEIRTQRVKADQTLAEDFEIVVFDQKSPDEEKKLEFLSVGQKTWVNECLSRAISLYLSESRKSSGSTLFSDETDGNLDAERKLEFMRMKRKVLQLSGCRREFFISHTPACVDHADACINMLKY